MNDKVINWYQNLPKQFKQSIQKDPTYKNTLIKLNSMCLIVGKLESEKRTQ